MDDEVEFRELRVKFTLALTVVEAEIRVNGGRGGASSGAFGVVLLSAIIVLMPVELNNDDGLEDVVGRLFRLEVLGRLNPQHSRKRCQHL